MESTTCLLRSCINDDVDLVLKLLNAGCDVDWCDEDEITPLQIASVHGNEQIASILISRGAAVDRANSYGCTPLMHAARHGQVNILTQLLQNKANVNARNKLGSTALMLAVRAGHLSCVRRLLESGASVDENNFEISPLIIAAQKGFDSIVKILADRGADVNFSSSCSNLTPLMFAALNGHKSTAQILVERGANVDVKNVCDKTALDIAISQRKRGVKGYLDRKTKHRSRNDDQVEETVIEATKNGNIKRIEELLSIDPEQKDGVDVEDGATPLMLACILGRLDIVKLLIEAGAAKDYRDKINGWTALMQAVVHGQHEIAKCLIECGVDVNIKSHNGCTAFYLSSLVDDVDTNLVRLLASKSAFEETVTDVNKTQSNYEDISPETSLKAWWGRLSNRFRTLKVGRTIRLSPIPQDYVTPVSDKTIEQSRQSRIKSAFVRRNNKLNPIQSWSSDENLASTLHSTQIMDFTLNIPSPKLTSDSVDSVIPPLLPLTFDSSISRHKSEMPPGKKLFQTTKFKNRCNPGQITNWFTLLPVNYSTTNGKKNFNDYSVKCKTSTNSSVSSSTLTPSTSEMALETGFENSLTKTFVPASSKLHRILEKLSLLRYKSLFEEEEIDFEAFLSLTDQDLKDLGIEEDKNRHLLLNVISSFNHNQPL